MSLIKDIYSVTFYDRFANTIQDIIPSFSKPEFMTRILGNDFNAMEWKDRMKHTTRVFHEFLPADFPEAVKLIEKIINKLRADSFGEDSLAFIFFLII
ncbi:MAG TPA: hypothetical protein VGC08_09515 [Pedobacter sp.]